jgi:hypothetical protein
MARSASGREQIEAARTLLREATTVEQLRQAQAVLLPLELGLSLEQTAKAIGRSPSATCAMRMRFVQVQAGRRAAPRRKSQLRNRAATTLERESEILDEILKAATEGAVPMIPGLKSALENRLGRPVALSTVYRMLARHGWRKLAPDIRPPQSHPTAGGAWKENSPARWAKK